MGQGRHASATPTFTITASVSKKPIDLEQVAKQRRGADGPSDLPAGHQQADPPSLSIGDSMQVGAVLVLQARSLDVQKGEFFYLLGPSGSGKTTALSAIAGFSPVRTGRILLADEDVTRIPPQKRQMGIIFQSYALSRQNCWRWVR